VSVQDINSDTTEELEQRDNVIKMSMGYGYLVVATTTQCVIYDVTRWNAPVQFDLRDAVVSIQQSQRTFLIADCSQGLQIYSYEGRQVSVVKLAAAVRPESLTTSLISLSADTVALRDTADPKKISFFDALNGKPLKDIVVGHHMDIMEVALSQYGAQQERKVTFIDRNRDLYLASVHAKLGQQKLATMVPAACWNDTTETLVALADGRLTTWYYPSVVFIDRDLLARTKHVREEADEFGRNDQIADFFGTRVAVRRGGDGALLTFGVSPYPNMLFTHVGKSDWEGATRLCRFLRDDVLWAILAALAIKASELHTAELAYAALDEVDKLRFVTAVKAIPSAEGRQAELALFQRRLEDAERVLLQAGLTYRAIEMHMNLHYWDRALEIAVERQTHLDTVVAHRQRHLESIGRKETVDRFRQVASTLKVDWDTINEKVKQEATKEAQRGKPYEASR
jgi:intraflagellar transport protein 80